MNFKINCETLLNSLNIIQKGLPVKTPMPILTGIKIDVLSNKIIITSCNSDISVQVVIDDSSIEIKETGNFIIPGRFFINIIRKINSKSVEIFVFDNKLIVIKAERSEFKLNMLDYNDYPDINFLKLQNPIVIKSSSFRNIVKEISFAAATSEKRPIITGVNFKNENNELLCVATDSYRLSRKEMKLENCPDFNIVIPNKSLDELIKIIEEFDGELKIIIDSNKVLFNFNNVSFQTRLLEGNYPDTSRIVPKDFPVIVKFNRDEIISAVERVSLLSPRDKEKNYNIIQFCITNNRTVEISSTNNEIGDAIEEIIPIDNIVGPIIKIAFSSRYLLDAVKSTSSSEVSIKFTGEIKPFTVSSDEYPNLLHVILPVKTY